MKYFFLVLLLALTTLAFSADIRAIKAGAVFQPREGVVTGPMVILIENGLITAVGKDLTIPDNATIFDLSEAVVIPGLIDCHTHLCWHTHDRKNDGYVLSIVREPTAYRAIQGVANARDMLAAGFTTVRDLGNAANYADTSLRLAIEDRLVPGPQVVNAGRLISPFGGQRYVIPERPDFTQPEYFFADTRDELKKAIRENIHYGAKLIKIIVDDQKYIYSEEDIRYIVAEAADAGLLVAAHCATDRGAVRSIRAGVASLEHGFSMTADTMKLCAAAKIPLVTTTFSLPVLQAMASDLGSSPEKSYAGGVETLRLAYEHGVTVAFGSDVINKVPGMDRGQATLSYIQSFKDAGATSLQTLQAMTINAAATLGMQQTRGEIKPGMVADIIALKADPLKDIEQLKSVFFVMKHGEVHQRGSRQ